MESKERRIPTLCDDNFFQGLEPSEILKSTPIDSVEFGVDSNFSSLEVDSGRLGVDRVDFKEGLKTEF